MEDSNGSFKSMMELSASLKAAFTEGGNAELLKRHLQTLVFVEFTTIPLYLTAVYSFTNEALAYSPDGGKTQPFYDIQQEALSVAVQEMYHLQGACNLANVFGVTPAIPKMDLIAGQEIEVHALAHSEGPNKGQPLKIKLGNLPDVLQYMLDIELPDPNPRPDFQPNEKVQYDSIGDLYHATLILLRQYLEAYGRERVEDDPHFTPGHKQIGYKAFTTRYWFNKIDPPGPDTQYQDPRHIMVQVINAITEQGEGNKVADRAGGPFKSVSDDGTVPPPYNQKGKGGRFANYDNLTHYRRFQEVQSKLKALAPQVTGSPFYSEGVPWPGDVPEGAPDEKVAQESLNVLWSYLIDLMQAGFERGNLDPAYIGPPDRQPPAFFDVMLSFKYVIPLIWQRGHCPSFVYQAGVTLEQVQHALDEVDPFCLYHWDGPSAAVRAQGHKNACQGLNACQGQGWGGLATGPGTGQCATADFHSCQGSNSCKSQGGCGFLSPNLPYQDQWVPGFNTDASNGGCQTPIAAAQVFDRTATIPPDWPTTPYDLSKLKATPVWEHARVLVARSLGQHDPPDIVEPKKVGDVTYDGTTRRKLVSPSST